MKDNSQVIIWILLFILIGSGGMAAYLEGRDKRELEFSRMCNEKNGIAKRIDGMLQCTVSRNMLGVAV